MSIKLQKNSLKKTLSICKEITEKIHKGITNQIFEVVADFL